MGDKTKNARPERPCSHCGEVIRGKNLKILEVNYTQHLKLHELKEFLAHEYSPYKGTPKDDRSNLELLQKRCLAQAIAFSQDFRTTAAIMVAVISLICIFPYLDLQSKIIGSFVVSWPFLYFLIVTHIKSMGYYIKANLIEKELHIYTSYKKYGLADKFKAEKDKSWRLRSSERIGKWKTRIGKKITRKNNEIF